MKNSRIIALVTGALILGLAIGGLGIANAWSGLARQGAMAPVVTAPTWMSPATSVGMPSTVATTPVTPPSLDATQAPGAPMHHVSRHVATHRTAHRQAAAQGRHMPAHHSDAEHHAETAMHRSGDAHHRSEGYGCCN